MSTDERVGRFHAGERDTEREAALLIAPVAGRLRKQVYRLLQQSPQGLTDDEGGQLMGGDRLTFGRRRNELVMDGLVRHSGAYRPTPSRRRAKVWEAVP